MKIIRTKSLSIYISGVNIDTTKFDNTNFAVYLSPNTDWFPASWKLWPSLIETTVLHATFSWIKSQ